ncbi:iron-sulfur cluster assembly accessory protein [Bradyrhizobium ottawaense]
MTTDVTISDRAARRIGEILKGEGSGAMLRISVEGGGCSGFQYKFDIDRARTDDDLVIEQDNAVVLVDSASQPFLAGSQVDFRRRSDRRLVPRQQSERNGILRLRHQLLGLTG